MVLEQEMGEMYLTEKQVSGMTGISVNTLQNWRVKGTGPVYLKPGGTCVRYPLSRLQEFMEERQGGGEV